MQDRVLTLLKTGLTRNPNSARANFELGRVFFKCARYGEAGERLRRAALLDPQFSRPHYFLGRLLSVQKRPEEAKAEFDTFQRLDKIPENRDPRLTR
jgi:tetratricopeptide (TPR) repeat protein